MRTCSSCLSNCRGPTLAPAELASVCTITVFQSTHPSIGSLFFALEATASPPPWAIGNLCLILLLLLRFFGRSSRGRPVTILRLMVVAFARLLLVLEWSWPDARAIYDSTEKLLFSCRENPPINSKTKRTLCN